MANIVKFGKLADRVLSRFVPKTHASACAGYFVANPACPSGEMYCCAGCNCVP